MGIRGPGSSGSRTGVVTGVEGVEGAEGAEGAEAVTGLRLRLGEGLRLSLELLGLGLERQG